MVGSAFVATMRAAMHGRRGAAGQAWACPGDNSGRQPSACCMAVHRGHAETAAGAAGAAGAGCGGRPQARQGVGLCPSCRTSSRGGRRAGARGTACRVGVSPWGNARHGRCIRTHSVCMVWDTIVQAAVGRASSAHLVSLACMVL